MQASAGKCYTIPGIYYIIHTFTWLLKENHGRFSDIKIPKAEI